MSASAVARTMLRTLARSASKNPIEVIVSCFIIVTLAYFQLLHAVTTSHFFEPLNREAAGLASLSFFTRGDGIAGTEEGLAGAAAISQSRDSGRLPHRLEKMFVRPAGAASRWEQVATDYEAAQAAAQTWIVEPVIVADSELKGASRRLPESALPAATRKLFAKLNLAHASQPHVADAAAHFDVSAWTFGRAHHEDSLEARRAFLERASDEGLLSSALNETSIRAPAASRLRFFPILSDYDLETAHPHGLALTTPEELRSVRWMAYAARALVLRFWALFKRADSADIFVMLSAYILMHGTFINLFLSMRKFGSRFWLGASVLISSIFAFMCALTAAYSLGVTVDPICLSEALPFLVIIVGFEKPYLLTRAVYTHPGATPAPANGNKPTMSLGLSTDPDAALGSDGASDGISEDLGEIESIMAGAGELSREESFVRALTARLKSEPTLRLSGPTAQVPVHQVILAAVESVGMQILRDYVIEITVMVVGASSGVSGLREFCQLAALILTFDCIALFAFYVAILTVMLEVHRIRVLRGAPRPRPQAATPPNVDSDEPVSGLATPTSSNISARNTSRQVSPSRASASSQPKWRQAIERVFGRGAFGTGAENMTARLKVLLIMSFLVLHSLNLVSTLTTQTALSRHHSTGAPTAYQAITGSSPIFSDRPDSPAVAPLLNSLIKSSPADADIFVRIMDPVVYLLVDEAEGAELSRSEMANAALNASGLQAKAAEAASLAAAAEADKSSLQQRGSSSLAVLDSFITGWTVIVGDPVIGKWMSLALAISIFLNAYLLKGIASGDAAVADRNAAGAAALAVARMVGAHLDRESQATDAKVKADTAVASSKAKDARSGVDAYHKQLAATSASAAKGFLGRLPQDADAAASGPTIHKPIAVPAKAVSQSAAASVHNASKSGAEAPVSADGDGAHLTPNARSEEWKSQPAGFVGQDGEVEIRSFEEVLELYAGGAGVFLLSDEEVILLAQKGKIAGYALEKILQDHERAVRVRRALISRSSSSKSLETSKLPFSNYDYSQVMGACCENVVGYMPLPVGIAGPLKIDGNLIPIPMATTEGTLVASTSRGCKALNAGGGVTTVLTQDAMTRGPALEFPSIVSAAKAKRWVDSAEGTAILKEAFDSTSRFARLSSLTCAMAGRTLYIRFATSTGDAMGMNMIGKGCNEALAVMGRYFPDMKLLALSGNYCIDKKASAINWILGRGKSVVAEAVIPAKTVETVLKTTVDDLVNLNLKKNLVGSAMAGSIGGMNAHAANIVAAFFLATGQDPAQVVESSMCMTLIEKTAEGDMLMTVSMPSLEVGTVGGGTFLHPQRAMLEMLGCAGAATVPGAHAQKLARCIAAAVMAGELSLLSALAANHLIQAHMKHNRSAPPTPGTQTPMRSETPSFRKDFIGGSLTPLVAPSVGSSTGPPSRGSPTERRDRRSASSVN